MRIAAISHSCVIDVNQQVYVELLGKPDVELCLITPEHWHSTLRGHLVFSPLPGVEDVVRPLPTTLPGSIHLHTYKGLGQVLSEFKPDLLYVDEEPYSLVTAQALRWRDRLGCRFVFYTKQNLYKHYLLPFNWVEQKVFSASDHAMVVSSEARDVLCQKGYKRPTTELSHGVDPELSAPRDSSDLKQRLGIEGPVVGYVGRIADEKGVWDLLAAARLLVDRIGPEFSVVLIGDGPARARLEEAAEQTLPAGRCCFVGSVAHHAAPDYINLLDVLVLPSRTQRHWKEQFGRVVVEGLACGVPIVGSTSGHIPAVIQQTGGGLVFREGDVEDLADKVQTLLEDPELAGKLAKAGRKTVLGKYSYARIADILHDTFSAVLDGGSEPASETG